MLTRKVIKVRNERHARSVSPVPTISDSCMKRNWGDSQSHPLPSFANSLGLFIRYCYIEQSSFTSPMQNSLFVILVLRFSDSVLVSVCFPLLEVTTVANHNYRGCLWKFFYTLYKWDWKYLSYNNIELLRSLFLFFHCTEELSSISLLLPSYLQYF